MAERVRIAARGEISPGEGKVVVALGRVLALFHVEGKYFALDNSCPHRGGPLGEGHLDGGVVVCPWHGWRFDLRSGQSPVNSCHSVRTVPIEQEGDELFALLD